MFQCLALPKDPQSFGILIRAVLNIPKLYDCLMTELQKHITKYLFIIKSLNMELNAVLAIFTLIPGDMFYQIWYDIIVNLLTNVFHAEKRYISMFYVE